jgi:hypothetical protein
MKIDGEIFGTLLRKEVTEACDFIIKVTKKSSKDLVQDVVIN